ncbi:hypothetical protein [Streptomyces antibioticus]|uniref:Uncharacterized protein n=1 Tax=Streptomyces antibioticus TaxID=1890 RepID=A0AAE6Y2G7_STRAT|nr:hypothetical protein [Streptomyces antibioticus]QIT42108.1 hypothetical protein HCX60_01530 [Streptomyces antibioticus]
MEVNLLTWIHAPFLVRRPERARLQPKTIRANLRFPAGSWDPGIAMVRHLSC